MSYRYEIRLSGEGGQGIVLAGVILAEAAAIYDGKNATQTQVYGPESRGGASKAEVIISDEEIDYPKAMSVDLLLASDPSGRRQVRPRGAPVRDRHPGFVEGRDPTARVVRRASPSHHRDREGSRRKDHGGEHRIAGRHCRSFQGRLPPIHRAGHHGPRPERHRGAESPRPGSGFRPGGLLLGCPLPLLAACGIRDVPPESRVRSGGGR